MHWVYAIYNKKHGKIYIGETKDWKRRLKLHNTKFFKGSYTSRFDDTWTMVYTEKCKERKQALAREKQLKSYKGREFVKKLVDPR